MAAFIEFLKALLYGAVEGITEWLPVSSTGHLILLEQLLPFQASEAFWDMFLVVVQLGAILAVVTLYWNRIFPFSFKKGEPFLRKDVWALWFRILTGSIPCVIYAFLFDGINDDPVIVAVMLILVGIAFIVLEKYLRRHPRPAPVSGSAPLLTYRQAFLIGLFQLIAAVLPGTSRSGATIIGGLLIGLSRTAASEFTFFLAIPAMAGASLLELIDFGFAFTGGTEIMILAVGTVVSYLVSVFVIRFLMEYIRKHDFCAFGWYRIALGLVVLGAFFFHLI